MHRELNVAARNPKLYTHRLRWGIVQTILACAVLLLSAGGFRPGAAQWFFGTLSHLAVLLTLLEGVRKTSEAISSEKREGTLGFLFLSTLSGADVVLGKFSGALIRSLSALLPFLPILAISLLVGGTTLGEFWRVALALVSTLVTSLSLCLLVSALSRERSIFGAFGVLFALCVVPFSAYFSARANLLAMISPFEVLRAAEDLRHSRAPGEYWIGIGFLWLAGVLALAVSSWVVPRVWQERPRKVTQPASVSVRRSKKRTELLEQNPVLWLNYDERGKGLFSVLAVLLLLGGLAPMLALIVKVGDSSAWAVLPGLASAVLCLFIWIRVAVQASTGTSEAMLNGSLELLLSTPLTVDEVVKGHWLALWKGMRVPAFCLIALLLSALTVSSLSSVGQAVWTSKLMIELLLEIPVLGAIGMWMGLKAKTRAGAVAYTIILGGLVPWMVCIFTILVQIVLIFRAMDQVKSILKRVRNGGHTPDLQNLLRRPSDPLKNLPPVIR